MLQKCAKGPRTKRTKRSSIFESACGPFCTYLASSLSRIYCSPHVACRHPLQRRPLDRPSSPSPVRVHAAPCTSPAQRPINAVAQSLRHLAGKPLKARCRPCAPPCAAPRAYGELPRARGGGAGPHHRQLHARVRLDRPPQPRPHGCVRGALEIDMRSERERKSATTKRRKRSTEREREEEERREREEGEREERTGQRSF